MRQLLIALLVSVAALARAADFEAPAVPDLGAGDDEFLKVDQAFVFSAERASDGGLVAHWMMPDGYYLYRHQLGFQTAADSPHRLGDPLIPPGKPKHDEVFGDVEVYYHALTVQVPLSATVGDRGAPLNVSVTYQGCADKGLCYPPQTRRVSLGAVGAAATSTPPAPLTSSAPTGETLEQGRLVATLASGGWLGAIALFFLAGIGLAFTPCVLPMVPILSSIVVGNATKGGDVASTSPMRAFALSAAYVLGMASTYAALGVLVGLFGAQMNLQAMLQSPPVLIGFALVFVTLSLAMFGFYELRLPAFLQDRLNDLSQRQQGGKYASVVIMGALSALVVSPCVSAPLAAALIYLSSTGDAWLGGGALLALGLGMGTPLLVIGASGGHLLPRAGVWMENVKAVFGVLLLGVAVWLLERVVAPAVTLALWALLAIACGVYLGALDFSPRKGWGQLWKASGAASFVYGVLLLVGAASGAENPLRPLAPFAYGRVAESGAGAETLVWQDVKGADGVAIALARADGRATVLDLYADWCISCKVMERSVFPVVHDQLSAFQLLRADVTDNDERDQALLAKYGLFGPPSMLFFGLDGRELEAMRIQGEVNATELRSHLLRVAEAVDGTDESQLARR